MFTRPTTMTVVSDRRSRARPAAALKSATRRAVNVALLALAIALFAGAEAQASTLTQFSLGPISSWSFEADSGEENVISIAPGVTGRFVLTDPADTISVVCSPAVCLPPGPCTGAGGNSVNCPVANSLSVSAGNLSDTITVSNGLTFSMSLNGEDGVDNLQGSQSNETLDGGSSSDTLNGGAGNDTIRGGTGSDTNMMGGSGTDVLSYNDGRATGVTASLSATGVNSDGDTFSSMEALQGSAQGDTLSGTGGANELNGLDGNDVLLGGAGADTLNGGDGSDTASYADGRTTSVTAALAGANSDGDVYTSIARLTGGPGDDTLTGDDQPNTLSGNEGDDLLTGGAAGDALVGGAGRNRVSYQDRATDVTASLAAAGPKPDGDTYAQIHNLRGGAGDDTLTGDAEDNVLDGLAGDDVLIGAGNDDDLNGGGGRNTASYEERVTPVSASLDPAGPKPDSDVFSQIQHLRGGGGNDTLIGDAGQNTLDGGPGADALSGRGGFDQLLGAAGADTVNAIDGAADAVDCGADTDTANVDVADSRLSCEIVRLPDADNDGHDAGTDCNEGDPAINPGAPEVPDNQVDENCDGIRAFSPVPDRDGDGFNETLDCDDTSAAIRPGAVEIPGNRVDENCDDARPDFPVIGASIVIFVNSSARSTRVTEASVSRIPAGGRVELRCRPPKGKRRACPFTRVRRSFPAGRRKLTLTRSFKGRRMPLGTVFEVRVTGPNVIGRVRIERVRRLKTTRRLLCLRPGASRPTRCPSS